VRCAQIKGHAYQYFRGPGIKINKLGAAWRIGHHGITLETCLPETFCNWCHALQRHNNGIPAPERRRQKLLQTVQVGRIIPQAGRPAFYVVQPYQRVHINTFAGSSRPCGCRDKAFLDGKTPEWYV
jgi:hypothetical protein